MAITADESGVETFQTARVGKFRKRPVRQVAIFVGTETGAKKLFAQRPLLEVVTSSIGRDRRIARAHLQKPCSIMRAQCFAPGKADQAGTVSLPCVPLVAQMVKLCFCDQREPFAKVVAVRKTLKFSDVRYAVVV